MKSEWRRYAPLGLYVSLLGVLATAAIFFFVQKIDWKFGIGVGITLLGLLAYVVLDPQQIKKIFTGRQARFGSNTLLILIGLIGILVLINFLVSETSIQWDLTADKENTLAKESIEVLQNLPDTVTIQAFYTSRMSTETVSNLLNQYADKSQGKLEYNFIDPDVQLALAQAEGITQDGTLILKMGERREKVTSAQEQDVTSALIRLMNPDQPAIYFLSGHGEHTPETTGNGSVAQLKSTAEQKNYKVGTFNLLETGSIPADARLVIVAGPQKPLSQGEVDVLAAFSAQGGSLIVMEDPVLATEFGDAPDPLAAYLSDTWGIVLTNDIIIDLVGQQLLGQPFVAVGVNYSTHQITADLTGLTTYFPNARSVTTRAVISGITYDDLVTTAGQSWGETDMDSLLANSPEPNDGIDQVGQLSLAMAAENSTSQARLIVFGNSGFAVDSSLSAGGNLDLIVNSIDWTVKQEELINLTEKVVTERVLNVPASRYTVPVLFLGSLCILPFGIVVAGIAVLIIRRRR